jgi:hypothetical protein
MSALRINKEGYFIFLLLLNGNNDSLNYTSYKLYHFINIFNYNHSKTNLSVKKHNYLNKNTLGM